MIFVLIDDGTLCVYESPDEVPGDVEPDLAEEVLRAVFDEAGRRYEIEWLAQNRFTQIFGKWLRIVQPGKYRLRPTEVLDKNGLLTAICSAAAIDPESAEKTVRDLERRLTSR